jgi:succinate dehydrogenase / fumarate reductase cytochrome b subunit
MNAPERPLSPFLNYRWGVTNTLSILHRITGVFLTLGIFGVSFWLLALAGDAEVYAGFAASVSGLPARVLLAGWVFCFFYHIANGIRHLVWDAGYGFEKGQVKLGGVIVVVFAVLATLAYVMQTIFQAP